MFAFLFWFLAIASCTTGTRADRRLVAWYYSLAGCEVHYQFELGDGSAAHLCDYSINVTYDRNEVRISEYGHVDFVHIFINNTQVIFKGHVVRVSEPINHSNYLDIIIDTILIGSGRLTRTARGHVTDALAHCDIDLQRNRAPYDGVSMEQVENEIMRRARMSLNSTAVCDKIRVLDSLDLKELPREYSSGLSPGTPEKAIGQNEMLNTNQVDYNAGYASLLTSMGQIDLSYLKRFGIESAINILVDIAIAEFVKEIRDESKGYIKVPDIYERFPENSSWMPRGEFAAIDGTFSDLTTLSRNGNAALSRQGLKFTASCGFALGKADLNYEKYKLKYGISVNGKLSIDIDGIIIGISAAIDFDVKPCRVVLQDLRITEIGQLKIHLTGVGPLNKMISRLITWMTNKWEMDIASMIESRLATVIQNHLNGFDCEKFRP